MGKEKKEKEPKPKKEKKEKVPKEPKAKKEKKEKMPKEPKVKKEKKPKIKFQKFLSKLVAMCLVVIILCGVSYQLYYSAFNFDPVVNDTTNGSTNSDSELAQRIAEAEEQAADGSPVALVNSSVEGFSGEEADTINNAITSVEAYSDGSITTVIDKNSLGDTFDSISQGDIFVLEGDSTTPYGSTYIAKVTAIDEDDSTMTLYTESPCLDEVFDMLSFNLDEELTLDNAVSITPYEGVTISYGDDASTDTEETVEGTSYDSENNVEVDNLTELTLNDETSAEVEQTASGTALSAGVSGLNIKASYKLFEDKNKSSVKLVDVDSGDVTTYENSYTEKASVDISGKVGASVSLNYNFSFNILDGIKDLGVSYVSSTDTDFTLELSAKAEVSSQSSQVKLGDDEANITIEGLNEKLIPLVEISFLPFNASTAFDILGIDIPLEITVVFYVDFEGNLKLSTSMNFVYDTTMTASYTLVEDSTLVNSFDVTEEETAKELTITATGSADADLNAGVDLMITICGINILDLSILKFGIEGNAEITSTMGYNFITEEANLSFDCEGYARVYLKLLDLNVKLKFSAKWSKYFSKSKTFEFSGTAVDFTIFELGTHFDTDYYPNVMSYGTVTAEDEECIYFLNENGKLCWQSKTATGLTVVYDEVKDFYSFCGIDSSYIYYTVRNSSGSYDIVRLQKHGSITRTIAENVSGVLLESGEYLYYLDDDDAKTIRRVNRGTLKKTDYMEFDYDVELMIKEENSNFYVVTRDTGDSWSWLFGGSYSNYYYEINTQTNEKTEYGDNISYDKYYIETVDGNYAVGMKLISSGVVRSTAEVVAWMSLDHSTVIETGTDSGWSPKDMGIVVTKSAEEGGYNLVVYKASDGSEQTLVKVNSRYAQFTLCQSNLNSDWWYYLDQDSEGKVTLNKFSYNGGSVSGQGLVVVKEFLEDDFRCDLESCSVEVRNNILYFYEISEDEINVLLRYQLD